MRHSFIDQLLPLLRLIANLAQKLLLPLGFRLSRRVAGHKVKFDPGTDIGMHLLCSGRFEADAIALCGTYVRADGVIVDVGANIGVHAVQFADMVPHGKVICVEPASATFEYLVQNTRALRHVLPINVALSNVSSMLTLYVAADNAYSGLKDTRRKTIVREETVACFRADDLLSPLLDASRVDLIKIDVEGFEHQVIDGMRVLIARHRPVIFCEIFGGTNSNPDPQATVNAVVEMGFDAFVLDGGRLRAAETHDDLFYNYFFVPRERARDA